MGIFDFLRWLLETAQYCDLNNDYLGDLPLKLQSHVKILGGYVLNWLGC